MTRSLLEDLFEYNDWANDQVCRLARHLNEAQLDQRRPIGFGSVRATLGHILAAEELWQDRWDHRPWAPLNTDFNGVAISEMESRWQKVRQRRQLLLGASEGKYHALVHYKNTQQNNFSHELRDLLLHVVNHGVHHRAQALNLLRECGQTVKGGLDYLFYRLIKPTVQNSPETIEALEKWKMEFGLRLSPPAEFDPATIRKYCDYGNWAMENLIQSAAALDEASLDRNFPMGMGSLRATLCHLLDAECWWYSNWQGPAIEFAKTDAALPFKDWVQTWNQHVAARDEWLAGKTAEDFAAEVVGLISGTELRLRLGETVVQLCGHGTHHRAQAVNMLRQLGRTTPSLDLVQWVRELETAQPVSRG